MLKKLWFVAPSLMLAVGGGALPLSVAEAQTSPAPAAKAIKPGAGVRPSSPVPPPPPAPRGPSNDGCETPQVITGSPASIQFDTATASTGGEGQFNPLCQFVGITGIANDRWYVWTATGTGVATLESCDTTQVDTKAAVYEGAGCPTTNAIACNDDSCGVQTSLSFNVVAGQQYTFQIGRSPSALVEGAGAFVITGPPTPPPSNDTCPDALFIGEGIRPFSTAGATTGGPPAGCGPIGSDIWFRYTPSHSGDVRISTCEGATFDTILNIYTGTCNNLTLVRCSNDSCDLRSSVTFPVDAGVEYRIRLGGVNGDFGNGVIVVTLGPPCIQNCPSESTPEGEPCGARVNNGCAEEPIRFITLDCNAVVCGSVWADDGDRDLDWYRFTLSSSTPVQFALRGELPLGLRLVQVVGACVQVIEIETALTPPCGAPAVIQRTLPQGQYALIVAPQNQQGPILNGFPCGAANAYVLEAQFAEPCPDDTQVFAGLVHTALGVAQLAPGSVVISNLGGSGSNGATIHVGPTAEGWRTDGQLLPNVLPDGASLVAAATGTVNAIPNLTLGLARVDALPSGRLSLTPDFTPISAETYRLDVFLGDTQVFSEGGRSGAAFERPNNASTRRMIFACVPQSCELPPCPNTGPFVPVFDCRFPAPLAFQIVGGAIILADRLVMTPEGPEGPITAIGEVALTAASTGPVELEAESIVFRRQFHTALGSTQMDADNDVLRLFSMGAQNNDGVRIEVEPGNRRCMFQLSPLGDPGDPANPIPDGAFIDFITRGIVNGVPETLTSTSRYRDSGPELEVTVDFEPTNTDRLQALYLLGGVEVGSEIINDDSASFAADGWVLVLEKSYDECNRLVDLRPTWVPGTQVRSPSGQVFAVDMLEVLAQNRSAFSGYTSADLLFSDIPEITIEDEMREAQGVCCLCDFNASGQINSQDFFDFITCFFGGSCPTLQGADFNFDQVVNSQDFFDFMSCFFAPPSGCN